MFSRHTQIEIYSWSRCARLARAIPLLVTLLGFAAPSNAGDWTSFIPVTGTISYDMTWSISDSPYVISCSGVSVTSGATLTIEAGVVLKFATCANRISTLSVFGDVPAASRLVVNGTPGNPVIFTSLKDDSAAGDTNGDGGATTPAAGDWQSVYLSGYSSAELHYADIRFGGSAYYGYDGVIYDAATVGTLLIEDSTFSSASTNAVHIVSSGVTATLNTNTFNNIPGSAVRIISAGGSTTLKDNTFIVPGGAKAITMGAGASISGGGNTAIGPGLRGALVTSATVIAGSRAWPALGMPYVVDCGFAVTISEGGTLKIEAGAVVKFATCPNKDASIFAGNDSSLIVQGNTLKSVIFTSLRDDTAGGDTNGDGAATTPLAGDWQSIVLAAGSSGSFSFADVRYAGSIANGYNSGIWVEGALAVGYSIFSNINGSSIRLASQAAGILNLNVFQVVSGAKAATMDAGASVSGAGNTATGFGIRGLLVVNGVITGSRTWPQLGMPYVIDCGSAVATWNGASLTIEPAVIVKFATCPNKDATLSITGNASTLSVGGTAANPVTFTSIRDDSVGGDTNGDGAATTPAAGDWQSIHFGRATGTINYANVRYGGSTNNGYNGALYVADFGRLIVMYSSFQNSASSGVRLTGSAGSAYLTGNTFTGNAGSGVHAAGNLSYLTLLSNSFTVPAGSRAVIMTDATSVSGGGNTAAGEGIRGIDVTAGGGISGVRSWAPLGIPYVVDCGAGVTVNDGAFLTIRPGTIIKFATCASNEASIYVLGNGARLTVEGAETEPVLFTSIRDDSAGGDTNGDGVATTPANADWQSIIVGTAASASLNYALVRFAGSSYGGYNGAIASNGALAVTNSSFSNNAVTHIRIDSGATVTLTGNAFLATPGVKAAIMRAGATIAGSGNIASGGGLRGLLVTDGTIYGNRTWPSLGMPYVIDCGFAVTVGSGGNLTVQGGTIVKFATCANSDASISVFGNEAYFYADGGSANPVIFTSIKDDSAGGDTNGDGAATSAAAGDWQTIRFGMYASGLFRYADIRYGGSGYTGFNAAIYDDAEGASLTVMNSSIRNSAGSGIRIAAPLMTALNGNAFANNAVSGVFIATAGGSTSLMSNNFDVPSGAQAIVMAHGALVIGSGNYAGGTGGLAVQVTAISESITGSRVWYALGIPYVVDCGSAVTIDNGGTLTIMAGAIVKFATCSNSNATINVLGQAASLTAAGADGAPVIFTSIKDDTVGGDTNGDGAASTPAPGDWQSIHFGPAASGTFVFAQVRYGGSEYSGYRAAIHSEGSLTVVDSSFGNNANTSIRIASTGKATLTRNSFLASADTKAVMMAAGADVSGSANTAAGVGIRGLYVTNGSIYNKRTWTGIGLPYVIECGYAVTVGNGGTLIIESGTSIKFADCPNRDATIFVYGSGAAARLFVNGTVARPVTFTSIKDDGIAGDTNGDGTSTVPAAGDWQSIAFGDYGGGWIRNADIRYGGSGYSGFLGTVDLQTGSQSVSLINNTITDAANSGLHIGNGVNISVRYHCFARNQTAIRVDAAFPSIQFNEIAGNVHGLVKSSSNNVHAEQNWWGAVNGPSGIGAGSGDTVSTFVYFEPFLTSRPACGAAAPVKKNRAQLIDR